MPDRMTVDDVLAFAHDDGNPRLDVLAAEVLRQRQRWARLRWAVRELRPAICGDQFAAGQACVLRAVLAQMDALDAEPR